jgi:hypothetical protein
MDIRRRLLFKVHSPEYTQAYTGYNTTKYYIMTVYNNDWRKKDFVLLYSIKFDLSRSEFFAFKLDGQ